MSYNQISRLLRKKGWTGKEVGQLLIASMLNDIKQIGQAEKKPLFTQADFDNMENSLSTERDFLTYGVYRDLYSSIVDSYNRGQGLFQQFYNGFYRLAADIQGLAHTEDAQKSLDDTPLIMTESQYNRLKAEAAEKMKAWPQSFCNAFFECLEAFLDKEKDGEPIDSDIAQAIQDTREQPGERSQFYKRYHEYYDRGYYTLEDGTRSDQLRGTEWEAALEKAYLERHKLTIDGKPATEAQTLKNFRLNALTKAQELYYHGAEATRDFVEEKTGKPCKLTDEQLERELSSLINIGGTSFEMALSGGELAEALDFVPKTTWTDNTDPPPEGLTVYDFMELYIDEERAGGEKEALQAFRKDCPALYEAVKAYIERTVPELCGLKPNQLYKEIITTGELEAAGLIGYEGATDPTAHEIISIIMDYEAKNTEEHRKLKRESQRGIAIIQQPNSWQVDENGDYREGKSPLAFFGSLDSLANNEEKKEEIKNYAQALIYPALSFLYAYNALMEILGKVYDLPELGETARINTSFFEYKTGAYNGLLHSLYFEVYGTEADKKRKREIIKEVFYELDYEHLKPTEEAIKTVTEELEALGISSSARKNLKTLDKLIARLETVGKGAL